MRTRMVLEVFLPFTIVGAAGAANQTLVDVGDWVLIAALFVTYAWKSRSGRFPYRPSGTVLGLMGLVIVARNVGLFDGYLRERWLVPISISGVACYAFAKSLQERAREAASQIARHPDRRRRIGPTKGLSSTLLAVALVSQEPRLVPARIQCPRCKIQLTQVATLGPADLVEWPQAMSEDRQGRYYVTQPNKQELPVVFDATGRRIAVLGASGEGPGEFRNAALITVDPRTDSVFVTDWSTNRLSVFSPQLKFVRSIPFPGRARALGILQDQRLVAMASISDRASVGLPFHIFRRDGMRLSAIGDQRRPYTEEREMFLTHTLAPSHRNGFWTVPLWGEYRIEHWTATGVRDVYLRRRPEWHTVLQSSRGADAPATSETPPSSHWGIAETGTGLLWVLTRVADPNRKRAALDTLRNLEGRYVTARDPDRIWDSVIELIDPAQGTVVVSQRFDKLFFMMLPSGKVIYVHETDAGIRIHVLALALSREERSNH